ncbi:MAG: hypothetical protein K2N51_05740, partial [Lachnospiraceae bacterium]|nr:hypothetical protein [Lachnospiraceae bacterium]
YKILALRFANFYGLKSRICSGTEQISSTLHITIDFPYLCQTIHKIFSHTVYSGKIWNANTKRRLTK